MRLQKARGAVLIFVAALIVVIFAAGALALKISWMRTEKLMINNICGLAALGAMYSYRVAATGSELSDASTAASTIVNDNIHSMPLGRFSGISLNDPSDTTVTEGRWDFANAPNNCGGDCFTAGATPYNALQVSFSTTVSARHLFGEFFSSGNLTRSCSAVAAYDSAVGTIVGRRG